MSVQSIDSKPRIVSLDRETIFCEPDLLIEATQPTIYRFFANEIAPLFPEDEVSFEEDVFITNNSVIEIGDESSPVDKSDLCACVMILIVGKTPKSGGGHLRGSRWRKGRWRTKQFVKRITKALSVFQDCVDNFCIHVYDDLDLSDPSYAPFYGKNISGKLINFAELANAGDLADKIHRDHWHVATKKCFTIVINRNHAFGNPSGRTPVIIPDVSVDPSPTESDNITFINDRLPWFKIAHEIGHMAGLQHCKDNKIHKRNGQFDPKYCPKEFERKKDELMGSKSSKAAVLTKSDCELFAKHVKEEKSCELDTSR